MRGLLVGRFQPFHRGHLATVVAVRQSHPDEPLLLGIGSAQASFTAENPFTAGERAEMIERALTEARVDGTTALPVPDIHQHSQWVAYLQGLLPPFERVYTNNPLTRLLFERDGFRVDAPPLVDRERYQGAVIRRRLVAGEPWQELVPPAVARYLESIGAADRMQRIEGRA